MQLTQEQTKIVLEGLQNFKGTVVVFGSRAKGTARLDSDLDLCLKGRDGKVPLLEFAKMREYFENSSLPFTVDLVDESDLTDEFRSLVKGDGIPLKGA